MHLDIASQRLNDGSISVPLTGRESTLMATLSDKRYVRIDRLMSAMHRTSDSDCGEGAVYVAIFRLRRKLASVGWGGLIQSAHGRGYILTRPVEIVVALHSVMVPSEYRNALERLLETHPDHGPARRVLASFVNA